MYLYPWISDLVVFFTWYIFLYLMCEIGKFFELYEDVE